MKQLKIQNHLNNLQCNNLTQKTKVGYSSHYVSSFQKKSVEQLIENLMKKTGATPYQFPETAPSDPPAGLKLPTHPIASCPDFELTIGTIK